MEYRTIGALLAGSPGSNGDFGALGVGIRLLRVGRDATCGCNTTRNPQLYVILSSRGNVRQEP